MACACVIGCSDDETAPNDDGACTTPDDLGTTIDLEIVAWAESSPTLLEVEEQGAVPLSPPTQGGWVLFAGVRGNGFDPCELELRASLRDTAGSESREAIALAVLERDDQGRYGPVAGKLTDFAHIPLCPNVWSSRSIHQEPYELTIDVTDRRGAVGSVTRTVIPECTDPVDKCRNDCEVAGVGGAGGSVDGGEGGAGGT